MTKAAASVAARVPATTGTTMRTATTRGTTSPSRTTWPPSTSSPSSTTPPKRTRRPTPNCPQLQSTGTQRATPPLEKPEVFQQIVDILVERYAEIGIDSIAGLDARGFILGPPIALALKKPFLMMRKTGKMPNAIHSEEYNTEYGKRSELTVQKDKIKKGDRVLIIDDLVATGGTLSSAINLVHMLGGEVVECACVVELKMFIDPSEDSGVPSRTKLFASQNIDHVPVWGLISEDVLTVEAKLPEGYVDDGEEH